MSANESDLKERVSMVRIAMLLRKYDGIDEYDVNYWNNLIRYFVGEAEEAILFDTMEDFKKYILGDYKLQYTDGNIKMVRKD